mgnify:CR=1 FL=1
MAGKVPYLADNDALDYSKVQSVGGVLPAGSDPVSASSGR